MKILKQLNEKAIWLLDTLNQDSIEKKLARMYSTAYVNFVLCRQVYWIKVYIFLVKHKTNELKNSFGQV